MMTARHTVETRTARRGKPLTNQQRRERGKEYTKPEKTYILRFTHIDSSEIEEVEHARESDAREHLALFGIGDTDTYSRIDLLAFDWTAQTETLLETRSF